MRVRSRRPSPREVDVAVITGPGLRADEAVAEPPPRRRGGWIVVGALMLAVLLVVAALSARGRGRGDVLALGSAPTSTGLPPVEGDGSAVEGVAGGAQSEVTPGDSIPGADPAAPGADGSLPGATGAAGSPVGAGPAAAGSVTAPGAGPVAGGPVPTTRPAGAATTVVPAGPQPGGQPVPPPPPPPPPSPTCTITEATARPNPVRLKGGSGRLESDVEVRSRPADCPGGATNVLVNGLSLTSRPVGGGVFSATIPGEGPGWSEGTYPITFAGATAAPTLSLRVEGR